MRLIVVFFALLIASCAHKNAVLTPISTLKWSDLSKRSFEVSAFTLKSREQKLPATNRPTIQFADPDRVSGMAGVNRYSLAGKLSGPHAITWTSRAITTRMAGPPEAMELESKFLAALEEVTLIELVGDELRLGNAARDTFLVFKQKP